jgi:lysyl-tRNA synthetase class 2
MGREEQIISERIRKLEELRKEGVNPYPNKYDKKQTCLECSESKIKSKVKTAGRLMTKRDLGKIAFANLRDGSGEIQIVLQEGKTPDEMRDFLKRYVDVGDFVGVEGEIFKTKTGQISILLKKIEMLSKSILPLPEKWHGLQDKEERYRKRYVDLVMNPEVREVFEKRAKVISAIREFLTKKDYTEVETPILQPIYGGTSAKPFESQLNALKMKVYLRISNEMYLKRLIGGGYEKIFEFSRDFRNEGIDATHNPEFTLMETMCAYADYKQNMDLVEEMLEFVAKKVLGTTKVKYQGKELDFKRPWKRIKMVDAIKSFAKLDVEKMSDGELKKKLEELKIEIPVFKRGVAIENIFGALVEEKLIQPTIVYDFPVETCGLAKPKKENPFYAERFEPYINGWELGNIYSELNEPQILEKYWKEQESMLSKDEEAQRMDEDFLNMLKIGMPPTSGVGIGVDRLVMLLTDSPSIRDVILFPFMKPEEETKNQEGEKKEKEDKPKEKK